MMTLKLKSERRGAVEAAPLAGWRPEEGLESPAGQQREAREVSRREVLGLAATYQFRHRVVVVDVSCQGVGVESHQPVPFAGRGRLRLKVADRDLEWEVSLRWCRLARTRCLDGEFLPVYAAGFRLLDGARSLPEDLSEAAGAEVGAAIDAGRLGSGSVPPGLPERRDDRDKFLRGLHLSQ